MIDLSHITCISFYIVRWLLIKLIMHLILSAISCKNANAKIYLYANFSPSDASKQLYITQNTQAKQIKSTEIRFIWWIYTF